MFVNRDPHPVSRLFYISILKRQIEKVIYVFADRGGLIAGSHLKVCVKLEKELLPIRSRNQRDAVVYPEAGSGLE